MKGKNNIWILPLPPEKAILKYPSLIRVNEFIFSQIAMCGLLAKSFKIQLTATRLELTTTYFVNEHSTI